jgi:hypothetical protein
MHNENDVFCFRSVLREDDTDIDSLTRAIAVESDHPPFGPNLTWQLYLVCHWLVFSVGFGRHTR